ncbi:hypothetical protein [Bdellovibrio bacteriovorus]|uniref:hypothetical protein n=1 Tax=Bdellovibrio bacteriovorus TaxID=959 RepID=UPI0035A5789C
MNLAAPLVPGPLASQDVLEWRIKLLKKHPVVNSTELLEDLVKAKSGNLPKEKAKRWTDLVKSDLLPTEIEKVVLAAVAWLTHIDKMSDVALLFYEPSLRKKRQLCASDSEFSEKFKNDINAAKENIRETANLHMNTSVPMLRAKIAAVELISQLSYRSILPLLIAETPRYLKCPNVNAWIEEIQFQSIYSAGEKKEKAAQTLKETLKSIAIDRNKLKTKIYQKWHIINLYEEIREYVDDDLRQYGLTNADDKKYFESFCASLNLTSEMKKRLLSSDLSSKEIAIDILMHRKLISSSNALDKIILETNAIRDKHHTLLFIPGTKQFLDLPAYAPSELFSGNLWDLLEKVTL